MIGQHPILTIAIPTYNRNEKLVRSIEVLAPQLNEQVIILILDNCSAIPVSESLGELINSRIKIISNKYNVGMAANIIRCFELCETEWMWLLGDDDVPNTKSVAGVLMDIGNNSDCAFLNYKSPLCGPRNPAFYTIGQEELLSELDGFGNLLFISVGVYNLKQLMGNMRLCYQLAYSIAPHLVYLFSGLGEKGKTGFLSRELHDFHLRDTIEEENWSWLSLSLCIPILYEIPLLISITAKRKFADYILTHIKSPKEIFSIIEQPKYKSMDTHHKRFLLRQIYFRSLMSSGLNATFFSYLFYDLKLIVKNVLLKKKEIAIIHTDDRI